MRGTDSISFPSGAVTSSTARADRRRGRSSSRPGASKSHAGPSDRSFVSRASTRAPSTEDPGRVVSARGGLGSTRRCEFRPQTGGSRRPLNLFETHPGGTAGEREVSVAFSALLCRADYVHTLDGQNRALKSLYRSHDSAPHLRLRDGAARTRTWNRRFWRPRTDGIMGRSGALQAKSSGTRNIRDVIGNEIWAKS